MSTNAAPSSAPPSAPASGSKICHQCESYLGECNKMDGQDRCPKCGHLACNECGDYPWIYDWHAEQEEDDDEDDEDNEDDEEDEEEEEEEEDEEMEEDDDDRSIAEEWWMR